MVETRQRDFSAARKAMIDSQLRTSGVNAPFVLDRMRAVPREDFVPDTAKGVAYSDRAIPLGDGRWLSAPLFHGYMLQEAMPRVSQDAIVVDGGSGYLAELVRPLVGKLTVLSPEEALAGAGETKADLILIDGAVEHVPDALAKALGDDGRLFTGILTGGVSRLARGRRSGTSVALLPVAEMGIPRLAQFDAPKGWSF